MNSIFVPFILYIPINEKIAFCGNSAEFCGNSAEFPCVCCAKNKAELVERVFDIWENLDKGLLSSLTNHAMRRFHGVVEKKGGWLGNK